jgi:type I restriction enzyme S subunit
VSFREDIAALVAANSFGALAAGKDWPRVKLGDVARVINGFAFQSKFFRHDVGTPLVRIRDVVGGSSDTRYAGPLPEGYEVADGDLLVGMDGDFNSAFWRGGPALLNQRVCRLVPDVSRLRLRFLAYLLPAYLKLINDYTSSVTVKHLSSKTLQDLPIPLPSVGVQDALVARIEELFAEIDDGERALRDALSATETHRRAVLKAAVLGDLTSSWRARNPPSETGEALLERIRADRRTRWMSNARSVGRKYVEPTPVIENLPELPPGWCWATLQELAFLSGGVTVDKKRKPAQPIDVPYLRVANVQRGHLDLDVIKAITIDAADIEALRLRDGDILLNEGGDRDKVGRGWVWREELPTCVHQNHVFKARPATDAIRSELVSIYLNELGRRFFLDESKQTTNLASIAISKVSAAPVAVPPPAEADVIIGMLADLMAGDLSPSIRDGLALAGNLRQSILAAAFRGELT